MTGVLSPRSTDPNSGKTDKIRLARLFGNDLHKEHIKVVYALSTGNSDAVTGDTYWTCPNLSLR